ncbi:hypothetical protein FH581_001610 [Leptospira weilii]|uniref:HNH endonuclease n=2 Tax=Leptospira weilii TaxID=28184 RepID=UPI0007746C93|nr:hypothetical protein [Leptospira weilii]OMI14758.1 hypothetical protein BUQ74_20420 [Leptospira weilii serovar Heyan]ULH27429.1 hypothetical protein FH586_13500 [Leptospira weilii]UPY77584.1 hypothetical protein FH581_001610 [Leptospira weilii]
MKKTIRSKIYRFRAEDFYKILKLQKGKCFLTGREVFPVDALNEHILPLRKGGEHEFKNICLVISPLAKLKRYFTEEEIVHMAADIISFKGMEYGYNIEKSKRKRK